MPQWIWWGLDAYDHTLAKQVQEAWRSGVDDANAEHKAGDRSSSEQASIEALKGRASG